MYICVFENLIKVMKEHKNLLRNIFNQALQTYPVSKSHSRNLSCGLHPYRRTAIMLTHGQNSGISGSQVIRSSSLPVSTV